ncbi:MAG: bifunctional 4-hydroxy-2-oxoglutarate aldolase/2-dehydro-3-deoxy-phosphogluconate aldolase [Terriglobales bacterium]
MSVDTKATTLAAITAERLLPVIRAAEPEQALAAAEMLVQEGMGLLELTCTVPSALRCLEELTERYAPRGILLGMGTVLDAETCRAAVAAGARFIVSPHLRLDVIQMARRQGVVAIPGAMTASEVLAAWEAGADFVKVFPCQPLGGPAYLRALRGPLPQVAMIPSGGVTVASIPDYLAAGAAAVAVGPGLLQRQEGSWDTARTNARLAREAVTPSAHQPVGAPAQRPDAPSSHAPQGADGGPHAAAPRRG